MLLPQAFEARMRTQLGPQWAAFVAALAQPAPVSIRANTHKSWQPAWPDLAPVPWCAGASFLGTRPQFVLDPAWHAGAYYVQEASSMLLSQLLLQTNKPLRVLDLCAAPGGKTTLLLGSLPPGSLLVANETIRARARILAENCTRWGQPNVVVTSNDPDHFGPLTGFFDLVLVDAPCSGEGLWRKQPQAVGEWSEEAVQHCSARQRRILDAAAQLVAPGGLLIYSTCTYAPDENASAVQHLLRSGDYVAQPQPQLLPFGVQAVVDENAAVLGYQCYPHRVQGEGFFVSVLQRSVDATDYAPTRVRQPITFRPVPADVQAWLRHGTDWRVAEHKGSLYALPAALLDDYQQLALHLHLVQVGTALGSYKGSDFIPDHALALSTQLGAVVPALELTTTQALAYLKRDPITDLAAPTKGWLLARHQGLGLGWLKAVPGRLNNYLPDGWRIRMQLPPEAVQ